MTPMRTRAAVGFGAVVLAASWLLIGTRGVAANLPANAQGKGFGNGLGQIGAAHRRHMANNNPNQGLHLGWLLGERRGKKRDRDDDDEDDRRRRRKRHHHHFLAGLGGIGLGLGNQGNGPGNIGAGLGKRNKGPAKGIGNVGLANNQGRVNNNGGAKGGQRDPDDRRAANGKKMANRPRHPHPHKGFHGGLAHAAGKGGGKGIGGKVGQGRGKHAKGRRVGAPGGTGRAHPGNRHGGVGSGKLPGGRPRGMHRGRRR